VLSNDLRGSLPLRVDRTPDLSDRGALLGTERSDRSIRIVIEIDRRLAANGVIEETFDEIAEAVREAAGAATALIVAPRLDDRDVCVLGTAGAVPPALRDSPVFGSRGQFEHFLRGLGGTVTNGLPRTVGNPEFWNRLGKAESTLIVPFTAGTALAGVVILTRRASDVPFSGTDRTHARGISAYLGRSLEAAAERDAAHRAAVSDERERIARDLHDSVIQRLYATNLGLRALVDFPLDATAARMVQSAIGDLDAISRELRGALFRLDPLSGPHGGLRGEAMDTVRRIAGTVNVDVRVQFVEPFDDALSTVAAMELLAALSEALSNAVRHARARTINVDLAVTPTRITLTVVDDGAGFGGAASRRGLANLRHRAEGSGGTLQISDTLPHGTTVVWSVPR
jgi:signal transduction histidine kinase